MQAALDSIVCHTPLNNLGFSRKGSALTFSVAFQALRTGLFEVGWGGAGLMGYGNVRVGGVQASSLCGGNTMDGTEQPGRGKGELPSNVGRASGELDLKGASGPGG